MVEKVEESKYGSRKYILAGSGMLLSGVALFTGFIDGDQFVDIIPMIIAIYGAGNVAAYFTAAKGK